MYLLINRSSKYIKIPKSHSLKYSFVHAIYKLIAVSPNFISYGIVRFVMRFFCYNCWNIRGIFATEIAEV